MKRIFLSMPYSSVPVEKLDKYLKVARLVYASIMEGGDTPVCTILADHDVYALKPKMPYEAWLANAFSAIMTCEEVWVLGFPEAEMSSGVTAEKALCKAMGIPVRVIGVTELKRLSGVKKL